MRSPFRLHHPPQRSLAKVVGGLALLAGLAAPAAAQFADPRFFSTDGNVNTVALSGDTLYVGGQFTYIGPPNGSCVALDRTSGLPITNWPRFDGLVSAILADGAGGWYVGGRFTHVNAVARRNLVHLRPDGALDRRVPETNGWVRALALAGDTLFVGGEFDTVATLRRERLAALDVIHRTVFDWSPAASAPVCALALGGGRLYVGGAFTTLAGLARSRLAAFSLPSGVPAAWAPAVNSNVYALTVGDAGVYAGGAFSSAEGLPRAGAACFEPVGGAVTPWDAKLSTNAQVHALLVEGSRVLLGGSFESSQSVPRRAVAAVDAVTGALQAWDAGVRSEYAASVRTLLRVGDALYLGGRFDLVGSLQRINLAAVDPLSGAPRAWWGGSEDDVYALAERGDTLVVGGYTRSVGGVPRANLAAFDLANGAATDWAPVANREVLVVLPHGRTVYLGGRFETIDGQSRRGAAAVDPVTGELQPWNPNVSGPVFAMHAQDGIVHVGGFFGGVGSELRSNLAAVDSATAEPTHWNPGADNYVTSLARDADTLYVGGVFWNIGGRERHDLAAIDVATGVAFPWDCKLTGGVQALELDSTAVFAGGWGLWAGTTACGALARLSRGTGLALPTPPLQIGSPIVNALAREGNSLYVGGDFRTGPIGQNYGLAGMDIDTAALQPWHFYASNALTVKARAGDVFAGGWFVSYESPPYAHLARVRRPDTFAPVVAAVIPAEALAGATIPVEWTAADDFGVESVDAELSRHGPAGPWEPMFEAGANTGVSPWLVTGPTSDSCYLRVRARDFQGNATLSTPAGPFTIGATVAAVDDSPARPTVRLGRPWPSPARTDVRLSIEMPAAAPARVSLLDVQGRETLRWLDGWLAAGRHEVSMPVRGVAPGLYFVHLRTCGTDVVRRLVIVGR